MPSRLAILLTLLLAASPAAGSTTSARSIGVLALQVHPGIASAEVQAASAALVTTLQGSTAISRVLSPSEIEVVVRPEVQVDLQQCTDPACILAVAGGLGGDFALLGLDLLMMGDMKRALNDVVVEVRVVDLRTGQTVGGGHGQSESAASAATLSANMVLGALGDAREVSAAPTPAPTTSNTAPPPASSSETGVSPLTVAGGSLLAVGVLALVASLPAAAGAISAVVALSRGAVVGALPTPMLTRTSRYVALRVPPVMLAITGGVLALLGVVGVSLGMALLGGALATDG
ncbi:MAG: hypothetical protein AB2A00_01950 [Myxococcota bacterium]